MYLQAVHDNQLPKHSIFRFPLTMNGDCIYMW